MKYFRFPLLWVLAIESLVAYAALAQTEVPENLNNLSLVRGVELVTVSVIMAVFALLSLVLKGRVHRTMNLVAGIVFALGALAALVDAMNVNLYGVYNIMLGLGFLVLVALAWLAFRLPKVPASARS